MRLHPFAASCCLAATMLTSSLGAATLALDGGTSAVVDMGSTLVIAIDGAPAKPSFLLVDLLPGPTTVFGQSVGLGFTPFLQVFDFGTLPPSGSLSVPIAVPQLPIATSATLYLCAAIADPAEPFGVAFSNGASLTIVNPPSAGATQGAFVGQTVVLGALGLADAAGDLLPTAAVQWTLVKAPAGSATSIENPTQPYPTLTPDAPGDYVVNASIVKDGKSYLSSTTVHAWRISLPPYANGAIVPGDTTLSGVLEGPLPVTLTGEDQPVAVNANGSFGPVPFTFPTAGVLHCLRTLRVLAPDGSRVSTTFTAFLGQAASLGSGAADSLLANLTQSGLDRISEELEVAMSGADIEGPIVGAPKVKLVELLGLFGNVVFSAYADVTNVTYSPVFDVHQEAQPSGFDTIVIMYGVKVTVKISGQVLTVPYSQTGTVSMSEAHLNGFVRLQLNPGSVLNPTFVSKHLGFIGFSLSLPGFPGSGSQFALTSHELEKFLEAEFEDDMAEQFLIAVEGAFESLASTVKFQPSPDVTLDLSGDFAQVTHGDEGVGFELRSHANAPVPKPGAPPVTQFLSNPTTPPTLPPYVPLDGQNYDFAAAVADDFLNQVLAAATCGGMLEGAAGDLLAGSGVAIALSAGQLDAAFPNAGFDRFDPSLAVSVALHGTVVPIATPTPQGPAMTRVDVVGLELVLHVATSYGSIPMMRLALDGALELDVESDVAGTLNPTVVSSTAKLTVLAAFPGVDVSSLDPSDVNLTIELGKATTAVTRTLQSVHLPSFGDIGLFCQPVGKWALGPTWEYFASFGKFF